MYHYLLIIFYVYTLRGFVIYVKLFFVLDSPRMEKSPLLANGYNHPPTHLGHMQYMQQFNHHHHHHPAAAHAIMNPAAAAAGLSHPAVPRPDAQLLKSQGLSMEALAR